MFKPVVRLDTREFRDAAKALLEQMVKKDGGKLVRDQGKLFVRDCVRATPPFGKNSISESYGTQKKIGEAAVRSDINRLFKTVDTLRIYSNPERPAGEAFRKNVRRGNLEGVRQSLEGMGVHYNRVLLNADAALHKSYRYRGKVRKNVAPILILRTNSKKQLLRKQLSHVGKAKAGWMRAATGLGLKLPNWIGRHNTPGGFKDDTRGSGLSPSVTVENRVSYAGDLGPVRILNFAAKHRIRAMQMQTRKLIEYHARKATEKAARRAASAGIRR